MFLFIAMVVVGTVAGMVLLDRWNSTELSKACAGAADELGWKLNQPGKSLVVLREPRSGLSLTVTLEGRGSGTKTLLQVNGAGRWPAGITIVPSSELFMSEEGSVEEGKVEVGDPELDPRIKARGQEAQLIAMMDVQARRRLADFVKDGGSVGVGNLKLHRGGVLRDPATLVDIATTMMSLARALDGSGSVPERLSQNARFDTTPEVRARNLRLLSEQFGGSTEARQAIEADLEDSSLAVRAAALRGLVSTAGYDAARERVARALETPDIVLQSVAAEAAAAAKDAGQIERLCAIAERGREEPLLPVVCGALAAIGDVRAEPALLPLLGHQFPSVREAAAAALGRVGTVRAVEPLMNLSSGMLHPHVANAARDSIRRIQERLGDAEAGRISVAAADTAGAVSIAAEGGEVSLVPKKNGS